jgi:uncharacterized membrane protein YedE/YeeE
MTAMFATLLLGFVVGFLGQRSRLCFVSGYRDFAIMRDTQLLKSVFGALIGAVVGYTLFSLLGGFVPLFPLLFQSPRTSMPIMWIAAIVGGLGVGLLGGFAGACPFRMHVLAAEGKRTSLYYLGGFYIGIVMFNILTEPFLQSLGFLL